MTLSRFQTNNFSIEPKKKIKTTPVQILSITMMKKALIKMEKSLSFPLNEINFFISWKIF